MDFTSAAADRDRLGLQADCSSCFGLCCVATSFSKSADFAIDKRAGTPCPNLQPDFGCGIHATLRPLGFGGCTTYTCYGAGQKISQVMFGGQDWRQSPATAQLMFQTLPAMRQVHELMWFVIEALDRTLPGEHFDALERALAETEQIAQLGADELSWGDVDFHCTQVHQLLDRTSETVRTANRLAAGGTAWQLGGDDRDLRGVDLRGADLRGADLAGADLRGADLRGVDCSGADLRGADLRAADLRGTNLAGTDLSLAIFLTQSQLDSAHGDDATSLSSPLVGPWHWSGGQRQPVPT